jgi:TonB-linked SusC/RagA family outer membrane protein
VILITTKRGQSAKPDVEFRASVTGSSPMRLPDKLGSYDYARLKNEALANVGQSPEYKAYDLDTYRNGASPYTHPDNDYFDDMLNGMAVKQQYNLVVRGGSPFVRYYVSANFLDDDGIYKTFNNSDYDANVFFRRYGLRSNLDFNVTKTTKVGVDVSGRLEERHNNGYGDNLYQSLVRTPPNYFNYVNPDGSLGGNLNLVNPYAALSHWGYQHAKRNVFEVVTRLNQGLDFLVEGLEARAMFSYVTTMKSRRDVVERPELKKYNQDGAYSVVQTRQFLTIATNAGDQGPYTRMITSELGLYYSRAFHRHNLTAMATFNQSQYFENAVLPVSYINYVGRATYDFDGRYLAELNLGYNGSMNFVQGHRYGLFPAVSAGWVVSNESFWDKGGKLFSYYKLRGSLGQVGNDRFGSAKYYYQNLYQELTSNRPTFGVTQSVVNRVYEGKLGNTQVGWERSTKGNIGFDSRFFKGRLSLTADLFFENRTGILSVDESVSTLLGMLGPTDGNKGLAPQNIGRVVNRGFELDMVWNDNVGKLRYYVRGNLSFARNTVKANGQAPQTYPWLSAVGTYIGQRYGLICDGFYNSYDEIAALPSGFSSNLKPGDLKYRDINRDGRTDSYDVAPIGRTQTPELFYGVTLGGDWNGFDLQLFWQGAAGSDIYVNGYGYWEFTNTGSVMSHHLGRWTPETSGTATYPSLTPSVSEQNHRLSTFWLKDGSYLRLKNAQIGYTLPNRITRKAGVANMRLFLSGANLLTFSVFKTYDPESNDGDGSAYPSMRQFTGGVTLKF